MLRTLVLGAIAAAGGCLMGEARGPDTAKIEAELMALVNSNWSPAELKAEMQESSKRRLFDQAARDASGAPAWDYEPRKDASKQFVRGGGDSAGATATKGRARYPFVPAKAPDNPT